ncbi:hypothetical protein [Haliangium sp.]
MIRLPHLSLALATVVALATSAAAQPGRGQPAEQTLPARPGTATPEGPGGPSAAGPAAGAPAAGASGSGAGSSAGTAASAPAGPGGAATPGGPGGTDRDGRPPRRVPPPPGADRMPLGPGELAVLDEIEADFERYQAAAEGHYTRMRDAVVRDLRRRSARLARQVEVDTRSADEVRKQRRLEATALLEEFIEKHPNHGQFTPDAMFRLADIYLDEADEEIERIEAEADPDVDPVADYSRSLALWQDILNRFPEFRQLPGTIYLLAHYGKYDDEQRSLGLFLSLVCANRYDYRAPLAAAGAQPRRPRRGRNRDLVDTYADCVSMSGADPALVHHAWVRGVADHHFDTPGQLDEAISAYAKVAAVPEADLYAEAVYKLAWSYYRRDLPLEAVKRFDQSIAAYDAARARGEVPKLELREEALQYISVAFTDAWPGDRDVDPALALARAQAFYGGRTEPAHIRDVWEALGRAFMDLEAYDQAIVAYRTAIDRPFHLHPQNPLVHMEIVGAYESKGDKLGADEAAGELASRYGPGTEWYAANEKDREAMKNQRRIGERMLYVAARNLHAAAGEARAAYTKAGADDPALARAHLDLYAKSVRLYQSFLDQYPESKQRYEVGYALA